MEGKEKVLSQILDKQMEHEWREFVFNLYYSETPKQNPGLVIKLHLHLVQT